MRVILAFTVCVLVAGPALAAGPGTDYKFILDRNQSFIEMGFDGAPSFTYGSSPLEGHFTLNLTGGPGDWSGNCEAEGVSVSNTEAYSFGFGATTMHYLAPDTVRITDFDQWDEDSTAIAGTPVASGTLMTEMFVYAAGYMSALSPPYFTLSEWVPDTPPGYPYGIPWQIQVADDNNLGINRPGTPEATMYMYGQYEVQTGVYLNFYINLAGAVPEPGTISLLALGALGLLRRRW
jgi:hypothetical protein